MDISIYASEDTKKYIMDGIQIFSNSIKSDDLDVAYLENGIIIPIEHPFVTKGVGGVVDEKGKIHDYSLRNSTIFKTRKPSSTNY